MVKRLMPLLVFLKSSFILFGIDMRSCKYTHIYITYTNIYTWKYITYELNISPQTCTITHNVLMYSLPIPFIFTCIMSPINKERYILRSTRECLWYHLCVRKYLIRERKVILRQAIRQNSRFKISNSHIFGYWGYYHTVKCDKSLSSLLPKHLVVTWSQVFECEKDSTV